MSKETSDTARQRAQAILDKRKPQGPKASDESAVAQRAEAAKTARLRELRLAKEAAEREVAARRPSGRQQRHRKALPPEHSRKENDLSDKVETSE